MLKTALNNIIPHIWKLGKIVPIPKPNKNIDKGTSYRLMSLLSVIADTGEEHSSLQQTYRTHHYTMTVLHTLNKIVAKASPETSNCSCTP